MNEGEPISKTPMSRSHILPEDAVPAEEDGLRAHRAHLA